MRAGVAVLALLVALAPAGCGGSDEPGAAAESARHLDPRSDAVFASTSTTDGPNWEQVKRLYARVVESGAVSEGDGELFVPPTLDGALGAAASSGGLSFSEDLEPLLGGTLYAGVRVEPAEPLSLATRDILERLDEDATVFGSGTVRYYDRDGRPLDANAVDDALREEGARDTDTSFTLAYQIGDAEALDRVIEKLRGQGLRPQPVAGVEDAEILANGVGVVGGDTLVTMIGTEEDTSDERLRERLAATGDGPALPELDGDLVALRAAPTLLGAVMDREELGRALATDAGTALRGAEAGLRLEEDGARADARVDFEGLPAEELPLPGPGTLELPAGEGIASASADQNLTTVFLARLARELYPESRFVRRVEALERQEGLRFEDEVLRQFAGPSFTVMRPTGRSDGDVAFGARSSLRDSAAMRGLLPRIAPALPDRPAVRRAGRAADAGGIRAPGRGAREPAGGQRGRGSLRGDGSRRAGLPPGPNRVVYGLIGDAFVVASSLELAREVAAMQTEPAPEAGTRLRADADELLARLAPMLGVEAADARELLDSAEASAAAEGGDITANAEVIWAR